MTMRISPLPNLGASVSGIDLSRPLQTDAWDVLRDALLTHRLLVFREQSLTDDEHVRVASMFGPVAREGLLEKQAVGFVSNARPDGVLGSSAASWHIDYGFMPEPYEALSLYGVEVPPGGTETWFADAVRAASDLPPRLRARVAHLRARHVVDVGSPAGGAGVRVRLGRLDETYPHAVRPVLWPHRVTGEEILGVWEQQTDALLPLEPDVSTALIEDLFAHLYRADHLYVHNWRVGDLVIWDNHAVQHARRDVGSDAPRTLRRVCIGAEQDLSLFRNANADG